MKVLFKSTLLFVAIVISSLGYSQTTPGGSALRQSRMKFFGNDIIKSILKKNENITFTRYFNGGFEVDSTRSWTNRVVYTGSVLADNKYEFKSKIYKRDLNTKEETLYMDRVVTYLNKKEKGSTLVTKQFLLDGLIEEITTVNKEKVIKCYSKDGKVINTDGCLLYTRFKFPKDKMIDLSEKVKAKITNTIYTKNGSVPNYILVNIESDYKAQKWNLALDFPRNYSSDNAMYTELVTDIMYALKNEKLEDYHFNRDINGNYYNCNLIVPITFNKAVNKR
ncbi:hypothetical protein [Myroides odoratimimus]|uniref:hypothetical protein n=1 Tax=Myroides odoratimimus TaxID=76832 RepID=UPI0024C014B9|nr:hypothetical protein [Myroides odoratimimus]WHU36619.1 hypothetical protein QNM93_09910 [Myroides odoratimimus]